jgi:CRP-like cAMP-binding protein
MPHGMPPFTRRPERERSNRFLATLPPHDFALLTPHLRTITLERGTILHDAGDEIERVYFPHSGMVSVVAVMQSGAAIETATIGRAGVIGASAGLGLKYSFARAIVQLPGTAAWLSASQFHAAANGSQAIRDLIVHYSGMLLAQVQQSVACNVLHTMEARLCRWLLQAHDCMDGNDIPLTQEFLGQMLGVRRTTVTLAAQLPTERGPHPIPARPYPNPGSSGARGTLLRVLRHCTGLHGQDFSALRGRLTGTIQLTPGLSLITGRSPGVGGKRDHCSRQEKWEHCHAPILFPH